MRKFLRFPRHCRLFSRVKNSETSPRQGISSIPIETSNASSTISTSSLNRNASLLDRKQTFLVLRFYIFAIYSEDLNAKKVSISSIQLGGLSSLRWLRSLELPSLEANHANSELSSSISQPLPFIVLMMP